MKNNSAAPESRGKEKMIPGFKLISGNVILRIDDCDGTVNIDETENALKRHLDIYIGREFFNKGLAEPGAATAEIMAEVREVTEDGDFMKIFFRLPGDCDKIIVTPSQALNFLAKYPSLINQRGSGNFFLTKPEGEYVVLAIFVHEGYANIKAYDFDHRQEWDGRNSHYIITPKIDL